MSREKVVEKKKFSLQERREILLKTNRKCAHCGIGLDEHDEKFSVEHIIPISKGGTHEKENLVALCFDCNQNKSNLIINPEEYYKYIDAQLLKDILVKYKFYKEDEFWLSCRNYFPEDAFEIYGSVSNLSKVSLPMAYVKKEHYTNRPAVTEFVERYHKKMNLPTDGLPEILDKHFRAGSIYTINNKSGIIAVLPIITNKVNVFGKVFYAIDICGIPCIYQKDIYALCIFNTLIRFMTNLCNISPKREVVIIIDTPQNDMFITQIIKRLGPTYEKKEDDGFESRILIKKLDLEGHLIDATTSFKSDGKVLKGFSSDIDKENEKQLQSFSKFLQRSMNLKQIK